MNQFFDRFKALTPEQRQLLVRRLEHNGARTPLSREGSNGREHGKSLAGMFAGHDSIPAKPIQFSLFFFSDDGSIDSPDKYHLLLEAAKFADENDFVAVWTPERHFQDFGGLYPNPSVLGAALAMITRRIQIRAGSVALPLHNPIRVAEEWSVVDNLSRGRVAISFASGWHPEDFVLSPGNYSDRREIMFRGIDTVQRLWSGQTVNFTGVDGKSTEVRILPKPIQQQLPVWITSSGTLETWAKAGAIGANILSGMKGEPEEDLAKHIKTYRESRAAHGHDPQAGCVTVMLHTYIGNDTEESKAIVQQPLTRYLRTFISQGKHLEAKRDGVDGTGITADDMDTLAAFAFERFINSGSLIGAADKCVKQICGLAAVGVDEIACLIDFGLDADTVMEGLSNLTALQARLNEHAVSLS